jgi:hypothetical protein
MQEFDNLPITTADGKQPSGEQIRKAIVQAGASRDFTSAVQPGNKVRLTYARRDHSLVVEVVFTAKSYSIRYVDSANLGYGMEGGRPVIHPNVNKWLNNLRQGIDRNLNQL